MLTTEQIQENLVLMANTIEAFNSLDVSKTLDYLSEVVSLQSTATETQASAKYHLEGYQCRT